MSRRHSLDHTIDSMSRHSTADMLRKLRSLKHQVQMLKMRLDEEEETELRPRTLRGRRKQEPS